MKLSHLYEAIDQRALLRDIAKELGYSDPGFYDIDDSVSNAAEVSAGIELFRLHLDTDRSAQILSRIKEIEILSMDSKPLPVGMEGLEYLDETSFGKLPHVHAFYEASKGIKATSRKVTSTCRTILNVYFLLAAINEAAIMTMSSKFDSDEVKYRAALAKACMKQLSLTPKDL